MLAIIMANTHMLANTNMLLRGPRSFAYTDDHVGGRERERERAPHDREDTKMLANTNMPAARPSLAGEHKHDVNMMLVAS